MIHHVFVFGVIIPTLITISVFVAFLICWFKFNMRDRFFKKQLKHQKKQSVPGQPLETVAPLPAYKHPGRGSALLPDLDHDPPEPLNAAGVRHAHRSHSAEFPDDTCSIEDPEAALCSHAVAVDHSRYYVHSTAEVELSKALPNVSHVTQTFHFPELANAKAKQVEITEDDLGIEDDGNGNYGHFVHMLDLTASQSEVMVKEIQCMIHQGAALKQQKPGGANCKGFDREVAAAFAENRHSTQLVQEI